jgi:CspA family cold shock protein
MEEGIIVRLSDKGFGFIARVGKDKDLFFNKSELQGVQFAELREGDSVEFEETEGPRGPIAVNVSRNGGGSVGRKWKAEKIEPETDKARVTISEVIEGFLELTPDLIQHLQRHNADIEKVNSDVFEHLVGELMASAGWDEVRLVGRNPLTHADIFALHYIPTSDGIPVRFFVEVKRWKNRRIGVEVFNQVLGAMVSERERYGWHGAIIVALGGVSNTRTFSRDEYRKKGLEVKDKEDVMYWLRDYKPNADGLWLLPHFADKVEKER